MTRNAPVRALGTALHTTNTENALHAARLAGWNVRKVPMVATVENGWDIPVPGKYAVVRDPMSGVQPEILATVGERYHVVQNEEHAAFLDALVHHAGGEYESATALRGGRLVYLSIKLPDTISVGGSDRVDQYVTAINSHDGTTPFMLSFEPIRYACTNMLPTLRRSAQFKVKHTQSLTGRVQEAREALQVMVKGGEALAEEAARLASHRMTPVMYRNALAKLFPRPSKEGQGMAKSNRGQETVTKWQSSNSRSTDADAGARALADAAAQTLAGGDADAGVRAVNAWERQREMLELALHSDANAPIADTLWGGLNAIVEYMDHMRPVAGDEDRQAQTRAEQALLSQPIIRKKEEARRYFLDLAKM